MDTEKMWFHNYKLAVKYYQKVGDLFVPSNYVIKGVNLGSWLYRQREKYYKGLLPIEKIHLLDLICMIWTYKPTINHQELCLHFQITYELYPDIINIPYEELKAKINYILYNDLPVYINGKLHPLIFMTNEKIEKTYNITLEDLITNYQEIEFEQEKEYFKKRTKSNKKGKK